MLCECFASSIEWKKSINFMRVILYALVGCSLGCCFSMSKRKSWWSKFRNFVAVEYSNACNTVEQFSGSGAASARMTSTITTVLCEANIGKGIQIRVRTNTHTRTRSRAHTDTLTVFSLDFLSLPFPFDVCVKHIACMNPLFLGRFKQLSQLANVNRCAERIVQVFVCTVCVYALLHAYTCILCMCVFTIERNGIKPTLAHVRWYEC